MTITPEYHRIPRGAIKVPVPDTTQQTDYSCGASCLQAVCKYYGVGPNDEWEYVEALGMDRRIGCHPFQIIRFARLCGLKCREYWPMTVDQIKWELVRRHPVLVMIQAWGAEKVGGRSGRRRSYRDDWGHGHCVVAIGYDRTGLFFEDPVLQAVRGYLSYPEFETRWRDRGPHGRKMPNYGVAIWMPGARRSAYTTRAERIR